MLDSRYFFRASRGQNVLHSCFLGKNDYSTGKCTIPCIGSVLLTSWNGISLNDLANHNNTNSLRYETKKTHLKSQWLEG